MANFSGAVRIADLNDFIAPSQQCVVSLNGDKVANPAPNQVPGEVQLQSRAARRALEPPAAAAAAGGAAAAAAGGAGFKQAVPQANGALKVTLHDCLACSGCITSAETVLLQHQSTDELLQKLATPGICVVISLSPQSRASLAALHGLNPSQALHKLTAFLRGLGVAYVLDTTFSRDMSLLETAAEFVQRFRARQQAAGEQAAHSSAPNGAVSMDVDPPAGQQQQQQQQDQQDQQDQQNQQDQQDQQDQQPGLLPMLASACPGWVCYAEKTHGHYVLPYISSSKSPQAVMGSLVKRHLAARWGVQPADIYHCSVMPCYDKKLEAARDDLQVAGSAAVPEVDCCITSIELQQLLEQRQVDLASLPDAQPDTLLPSVAPDGRLYGYPGGSGGYMDYVMRVAAAELYGLALPPGRLPTRTIRNADFQELLLEHEGRVLLRFASAYGFRNIQTLMRKIKLGRCEYDYVEVMACPGGCLNGGGQLKPQPGQSPAQLLAQLEEVYEGRGDVVQRRPEENGEVAGLYREWVGAGVGSQRARELLHTVYHKREKTVSSAMSDW